MDGSPDKKEEVHHDVIIIDDDKEIALLLSRYLKEIGFEPEALEDGMTGLVHVKKYKPKFILLDLLMPRLNGFDFLKRMAKDEQIFDIPVVVMSAVSNIDDIKLALKLGAKDYIAKPFSLKALKEKLSKVLQIDIGLHKDKTFKMECFLSNNAVIIELDGYLMPEELLEMLIKVRKSFSMIKEDHKKLMVIFHDIDPESLTPKNLDLLFEFYTFTSSKNPEFIKLLTNKRFIVDKIKKHPIGKQFEIVESYVDGFIKMQLADIYDDLGMKLEYLKPNTTLIGDIFNFKGKKLKNAYETITEEDILKYKTSGTKRVFYEKDLLALGINVKLFDRITDLKMLRAIQLINPENVTLIDEPPKSETDDKKRKNTVLIVDDDSSITDLVSRFLSTKNLKILAENDPRIGFNTLLETKPDVVILDLMMPEYNGYMFLKDVKTKIPNPPPVIILTAISKPEYVKRAIELGAADFVVKPIDFKSFYTKIIGTIRKASNK